MSLEFVWLIILLFFLLFSFLLYVVFLIYAGSRLNIYLFLWYLIWVYRTEGILVRIYICTWAVYIIIVLLFVPLCSLPSTVFPFSRDANLGRSMVIIVVCKASVLELAREICLPRVSRSWAPFNILHKNSRRLPVANKIYRYKGFDKSLTRPTSRFILFDFENISFDAGFFIYIYK